MKKLSKPSYGNTCAAVVTYNPAVDFSERLNIIRHIVPFTVVVDNASGRGGFQVVRSAVQKHVEIELVVNRSNLGIATALNQAVKIARARGYKWLLMFDQDTRPAHEILSKLSRLWQAHPDRECIAVVGSNYSNPKTGRPIYRFKKGCNDYVKVAMCITSGSLISLDAVEDVGPFRDELFIDCVDTEMCLRLRKKDFGVIMSKEPLISHPIGDQTIRSILGKTACLADHSAQRRYYIARNRLAMAGEFFLTAPGHILRDLRALLEEMLILLLFQTEKKQKFLAYFKGIFHALTGRSGRYDVSREEIQDAFGVQHEPAITLEEPAVGIMLLNWNGWEDTLRCLDSLKNINYRNFTVLLVDNGSTDGSVDRIREAYPELLIIENKKNLGFAAGNNVGIKRFVNSECDYIWLLNTDAVVEENTLSELVASAELDGGAAAVGAVVYHMDSPGKVQAWGGARVNMLFGCFRHHKHPVQPRRLSYLVGASMLCRAEALIKEGMFDEGFFLTWEDVDLCFRFRKAGWRLRVAPLAHVWHRKSSSTGGTSAASDMYFYPSAGRFFKKHAVLPFLPFMCWIAAAVLRRVLTFRFKEAGIVLSAVPGFFVPGKSKAS